MSSPRDHARPFTVLCTGFLTAAFALLMAADPAPAQQGAVAGQVVDAETSEPVQGAQVFIEGTRLGQLTNRRGQYRITGVPVGDHTVVVQLIGYRENTQVVNVQAGAVAQADFELEQTALRLQEVVVTGVAAETPRVKLPFSVDKLDAAELPVPSSNLAGLLQGKAAGVTVTSAGGQPGSEADILLRGPTSINATGRDLGPLVVVDGVIASTGGGLADINSLDIESIEIVKGAAAAALYGSRAQTGVIQITTKSGAEQESGTFDVTVRNEFGTSDLERVFQIRQFHTLAMNEDQTGFLDDEGNEVEFGPRVAPEAECPLDCFQDNPFPVRHDNFETFVDPGDSWSLYGAMSGSFQDTNFRVSAENFSEEGVLFGNDGFDRRNARVNVDHRVADDFSLSASGFVSRSFTDEVATGAPGEAAFFGIVFMSPAVDIGRKTKAGQFDTEECTGGPANDCWFVIQPDPKVQRDNPLWSEQAFLTDSERKRTMGSLQLNWTPAEFFELEGTFSYDRTDNNSTSQVRKNTPTAQGPVRDVGSLSRSDFLQEAINATVTASLNRAFLDDDLTGRLRFRYLVEDQETTQFSNFGENLTVEGLSALDALTDKQSFVLSSQFTEIKAQTFLTIGSVDYKGRYIADGLIRRDGSSLFGPDERWNTYFRGSAAWRISQEPWFDVGPVDELKLRYSIGTAGARPNFFAQFETFDIGSGGSLNFSTLGNKALKPEQSTEQEAGVNLVLFDRLSVDASYSFQETEDQLLEVPLPGAFGFNEQWRNAGTLEAETWETSLQGSLIETQDLSWNAQFNFHRTTQEITELGVPPFKFGPTTQTGAAAFFAREGEPVGTFYGNDFARNCQDINTTFGISQSACQANFDVNDDGYMVFVGDGNTFMSGPGEDGVVQTGDDLWGTTGTVEGQSFSFGQPLFTDRVDPLCLENNPDMTAEECTTNFLPLGTSQPDAVLSLSNTFRYKGFSLYGLLDATLGFQIYNQTQQWSFAPEDPGSGSAEVDQAGKPEGLKKPIAYYNEWTYRGNVFNAHFVEDGDFMKLRELSLSYSVPRGFLNDLLGGTVDGVNVSLIGRNLFTVTGYSGYDPEVGFGKATGRTGKSGSATLARFDAFQYPNFRSFTGAIEITF